MDKCLCGSEKLYDECCGPLLEGERSAATPEELMRSRYAAYARVDLDYIAQTMRGEALKLFNRQAARDWLGKVEWLGLTVLNVHNIQPNADVGFVEFCAKYKISGKQQFLCELSKFEKFDGCWFYTDGKQIKIGRNDPCPCGSGKKYKKCCSA